MTPCNSEFGSRRNPNNSNPKQCISGITKVILCMLVAFFSINANADKIAIVAYLYTYTGDGTVYTFSQPQNTVPGIVTMNVNSWDDTQHFATGSSFCFTTGSPLKLMPLTGITIERVTFTTSTDSSNDMSCNSNEGTLSSVENENNTITYTWLGNEDTLLTFVPSGTAYTQCIEIEYSQGESTSDLRYVEGPYGFYYGNINRKIRKAETSSPGRVTYHVYDTKDKLISMNINYIADPDYVIIENFPSLTNNYGTFYLKAVQEAADGYPSGEAKVNFTVNPFSLPKIEIASGSANITHVEDALDYEILCTSSPVKVQIAGAGTTREKYYRIVTGGDENDIRSNTIMSAPGDGILDGYQTYTEPFELPGGNGRVYFYAKENDKTSPLILSAKYSLPTGVETIIDEEDRTPEYYDLLGRRVENPSHGVFIVRDSRGVRKIMK